MEQLEIVVGESGPWTLQEFVDANSLKRTPLGELSLEFHSFCLALRSPAKRTGVPPQIHSNRSASSRDTNDDRPPRV